jgi:sulfopyruvate decarboxylase subunit alpha
MADPRDSTSEAADDSGDQMPDQLFSQEAEMSGRPTTGSCVAHRLARELLDEGFGPYLGTPCGILAPLLSALEDVAGLLTIAREDVAVGAAVGCSLAGQAAVVLMQNSGLGQSVNALASLVVPYQVPILLVVSLRGVAPDTTPENAVMGRLTGVIFEEIGVPSIRLAPGADTAAAVAWAGRLVRRERRTAALLIEPSLFGWTP